MVDFWEVVGRLTANGPGDAFFTRVFGAFSRGSYQIDTAGRAIIPPAPLPRGGGDAAAGKDHYGILSGIINPVFVDHPISLMAVGETLYMISFQTNYNNLSNLGGIVKGLRQTATPSNQYYQALGAMIIDSQLLAKLQGGTANFKAANFGQLSASEYADLTTIANNAGFQTAAGTFC